MSHIFQPCRLRQGLTVTGVLLGLAPLLFAVSVQAQNIRPTSRIGPNINYTIHVSLNSSNQCVYEILDYDDQDFFVIKPVGRIMFTTSEGTRAHIEFSRHTDRGRHYGQRGLGIGQPNSFEVPAGDSRTVVARNSFRTIGNNVTRHKVWISCLTDEGEVQAQDAVSAGSKSSFYDDGTQDEKYTQARGPMAHTSKSNAEDETDPARKDTGGPTMEVDDP